MRIESAGITDVGLKRDRNEDAFLTNEDLGLYIVADGMGGHAGGAYASSLAVTSVESSVEVLLPGLGRSPEIDPVDEIRDALAEAVRVAGRAIHGWASEHPEFRGMGTTIVVALLVDGNAYVAHVGDSRAYLMRDGEIEQITEDHSFVAQSVREGLLTESAARTHKMRSVITRALGFQPETEVDVLVRALRRGDRLLLCTDGLSGKVEAVEMAQTVAVHEVPESLRQLVGLACARGGDDNISAVVVRVETT